MNNQPLSSSEIESICNKLIEIMKDADGFNASDSETTAQICNDLKKLQIANALYSMDSIAITGLQGAGKTTFARTIYDIDRNILDIGAERSETIPVLIKETAKKGYEMRRHYIQNESNWEFVEEKVDSLVIDTNDDTNILYQELAVPQKTYFNGNPNKGFVLMPGIESGDYFGGLLDFTLACTSTAVIVVSDNNIPNNSFDMFLKKNIKAFIGTQPIFVLTGCDNYGEETVKEYKESLIEKCCSNGIPIIEEQVLVSTVQEDRIEKMQEDFCKLIKKYCKVDRIRTQAHFNDILNDILRCLKVIDQYVETENERKRIEFERNNQDAKSLLSEAECYFAEARKTVEAEIHTAITNSKIEALKNWEDNIKPSKPCGPFESRRITKGRTKIKDEDKFQKAVESSIGNVLFENHISKVLGIDDKKKKSTNKNSIESKDVIIDLPTVTPQSCELIVNLSTPNSIVPFNLDKNDTQSTVLFKDALKTISYLGTRYYMETLTKPDEKDILQDIYDFMPGMYNTIHNVNTSMSDWADQKQQQLGQVIGKVGAAVIGIDALDGKLDSVEVLKNMTGGGEAGAIPSDDALKELGTIAKDAGVPLSPKNTNDIAVQAVKKMAGIVAANPVAAGIVAGGAVAFAIVKEVAKGLEAKAILVGQGKTLIGDFYNTREDALMEAYDKGIEKLQKTIYDNIRNHAQELLDQLNRTNYSRRKEAFKNELNKIIKRLESIESNARIIQ